MMSFSGPTRPTKVITVTSGSGERISLPLITVKYKIKLFGSRLTSTRTTFQSLIHQLTKLLPQDCLPPFSLVSLCSFKKSITVIIFCIFESNQKRKGKTTLRNMENQTRSSLFFGQLATISAYSVLRRFLCVSMTSTMMLSISEFKIIFIPICNGTELEQIFDTKKKSKTSTEWRRWSWGEKKKKIPIPTWYSTHSFQACHPFSHVFSLVRLGLIRIFWASRALR